MQFFIGKTLFKKGILGGTFFLFIAVFLFLYLFEFTPKDVLNSRNSEPCEVSGGKQKQCWQDIIEMTLKEAGVAEAFGVVADLYNSEPEFARDCHGYVHEIGEEAYELFAAGKEMELNSKTSYCGYGFYHGFMETLLLTTGDVEQGREFCKYVDEQLYIQKFGAATACYHGVGHGAVDGGDPRAWGDADAMIAPGFEFCQAFAETPFQEYLCVTGIFNAIEILSADLKYQLQDLQKEPFSLCHMQQEKYREPCYTNMVPAILRIAGNDFAKAAEIIEKGVLNDENYEIRNIVLSALFHEFIRVYLNDKDYVQKGLQLCRSLQERPHLSCIDGLSGGHMKYGEPGKEHIQAIAFCGFSLLSGSEAEVCFKHILSRLRVWYPQKEAEQICRGVKQEYQKFCNLNDIVF